MFVKLMGPESCSDFDSRKTFRLLDNVESVHFARPDDEDQPIVVMSFSDGETEKFPLYGNVYIFNEFGSVISTFGIAPLGDDEEKVNCLGARLDS